MCVISGSNPGMYFPICMVIRHTTIGLSSLTSTSKVNKIKLNKYCIITHIVLASS